MFLPNYPQIFRKAIRLFIENGKNITGIYDLLLRGTAAQRNHIYIDDWSSLDLSIIVDCISDNVLNQYRQLYREINMIFPRKLSITLVTARDFFSSYHHHGIKPIYYNQLLKGSISLLQQSIENKNLPTLEHQRYDCLANVAYLMHDLLGGWLQVDLKSYSSLFHFFCYITKRAKHMIRNSLFIITGTVNEEIDPILFRKTFPNVNLAFPECLKIYRQYSEKNSKLDINKKFSKEDLKEKIILILVNLEKIRYILINFVEKDGRF
jgi:hypothetical protein